MTKLPQIVVRPQGTCGRTTDALLMPIARLWSGHPFEVPQSTRWWNNMRLTEDQTLVLDHSRMAIHEGDPHARTVRAPWSHIPWLSNWKTCAVLVPRGPCGTWYVGWIVQETLCFGLSRIPNTGAIRTLIGPSTTLWFALAEDGTQIVLDLARTSRIGDGGPDTRLPLR